MGDNSRQLVPVAVNFFASQEESNASDMSSHDLKESRQASVVVGRAMRGLGHVTVSGAIKQQTAQSMGGSTLLWGRYWLRDNEPNSRFAFASWVALFHDWAQTPHRPSMTHKSGMSFKTVTY